MAHQRELVIKIPVVGPTGHGKSRTVRRYCRMPEPEQAEPSTAVHITSFVSSEDPSRTGGRAVRIEFWELAATAPAHVQKRAYAGASGVVCVLDLARPHPWAHVVRWVEALGALIDTDASPIAVLVCGASGGKAGSMWEALQTLCVVRARGWAGADAGPSADQSDPASLPDQQSVRHPPRRPRLQRCVAAAPRRQPRPTFPPSNPFPDENDIMCVAFPISALVQRVVRRTLRSMTAADHTLPSVTPPAAGPVPSLHAAVAPLPWLSARAVVEIDSLPEDDRRGPATRTTSAVVGHSASTPPPPPNATPAAPPAAPPAPVAAPESTSNALLRLLESSWARLLSLPDSDTPSPLPHLATTPPPGNRPTDDALDRLQRQCRDLRASLQQELDRLRPTRGAPSASAAGPRREQSPYDAAAIDAFSSVRRPTGTQASRAARQHTAPPPPTS